MFVSVWEQNCVRIKIYLMLSVFLTIVTVSVAYVAPDELQDVPTYFAKKNKSGNFINAADPSYWIKIHSVRRPTNAISTASLHVRPSIVSNGGWVNVSWKGVEKPTKNDTIAFYCPNTAQDNDYLDYFKVDVSPSYRQGSGQYSVQLFNIRTNCEFRYFRNNTMKQLEFVATSNIVMFEGGPEKPLQIHLALTGDPTQMRVMWVSGTDDTPIVTFNETKSHERVVAGRSQTYKGTDFCFLNGKFIDPGYIHDVLLKNLEPSTIYYYSCGVPGHMSDARSFKTAPLVGSDGSYKFIVYGDHGLRTPAHATAKYVTKDVEDGYEFIFHNGDISYARGYEYIWEQWHSLIQPYASKVPYMVGIGNHEQDHIKPSKKDRSVPNGAGFRPLWGNYGDDSNGECGVPMFYRFHMPDNGNYLWWYSYDYGMVHFIMMSTEHDMGRGSPQYTWLENDLRNVDRSKTPWIIVGGHRPMYTSELEPLDYYVAIGMQALLEDLFHEYNVDLAFWAHYHSYERTCAVYKQECFKDQGTVHIVIGTAGQDEDTPGFFAPDWSLVHRKVDPYGYGRVTVANRSALHWEYFVNSEEKVFDHVWLVKDRNVV